MSEVYNNPEKIDLYRMKVLRSAMKLELAGLKRRGNSVFHIVRSEFGLKGNRQKVYEDFSNFLLDVQSDIK